MTLRLSHSLIGILLLGLTSPLVATSDFYYDNIKRGFGIRALTMAGAYTALGEEGGGMSFNPAGMAQAGALFAWETFDTNKDALRLSSAQSLYASPFGISQWRTKSHGGDRLNVTTYAYGRKGSGRIDWGIAYKTVKYRSDNTYENGWTGDLGLLLHISPQLRAGFVAKDAYKKNVTIPTTFASGLAFFTPNRNIILTADWVQNRQDVDNPVIRGHYGAELHISDGLLLRGGLRHHAVTGGAGLIFRSFELDFGVLTDTQNDKNETTYMFGLKLGKGVQNYRHRRQYAIR